MGTTAVHVLSGFHDITFPLAFRFFKSVIFVMSR